MRQKAIGWFIDEYGIAQVSMNITDISVTPLHIAFDEVCRAANARGLRVTGTEIVGLVPKRTLIEAGRYFLHKQQRSTGISEDEIIRMAVKSMGLDELTPFRPEEKVIEFMIAQKTQEKAHRYDMYGICRGDSIRITRPRRRLDIGLYGSACRRTRDYGG